MSIKTIIDPASGRGFKLGRRRPVAKGPRLSLNRYIYQGTFPVRPPTAVDYSGPALAVLNDVEGNDTLGDCVCAGLAHIVGVTTGNAGDLFHATLEQVIKSYSEIGGYVPGNPDTDCGCDEITALNFVVDNGFVDGTKALGWLAVDPTDQTEVKGAMFLFENLMFGISLPDSWINPMPAGSGFIWDVAGDPDPNNGHCIIGYGYNATGVLVDSWGYLGTVTWAAIAKYCVDNAGGALYTILTPDQLAKAALTAPNSVAWSALIRDFDAIGGHVPALAVTA